MQRMDGHTCMKNKACYAHVPAMTVIEKCTTEVNGQKCGLVRVIYTRTGTNMPTCELHKHAEWYEQSYYYNNTVFTQWRSCLKSYIKGGNCKLNRFAIQSQKATQRHFSFDRDKIELLSAHADYQIIINGSLHTVRAYNTASWNTNSRL